MKKDTATGETGDTQSKFDQLSGVIASSWDQAVSPTPPLRQYLKDCWHIVNPGTIFTPNWHIDAIADILEATTRHELRDVLITVPPRHTKSYCVSIAWPTWAWIDDPARRFLFASYQADLSTEHAVQSRRVIENPWYQRQWPHVTLTTDQNVKTRYENSQGGHRTSTSVGGGATGKGADFLVCDDPHNLKEIHSEVMRKAVLDWYGQVWSTRLNDPKRGAKVVIMQRGHMNDLAGELKDMGYVHLNLPTEYEPPGCMINLPAFTFKDPRTKRGELLCPERFGADEVIKAKNELLEFGYAAQHQQNPVPYGGGLFKREWFTTVDMPPPQEEIMDRIRFWDCAATIDGGDWTVGTLVSVTNDGRTFIEDVIRTQAAPGTVNKLIIEMAHSDGKEVRVGEEQEGGSAGKAVVAQRARQLGGWAYHTDRPTGDKLTRWMPLASQASAGNVFVVQAEWNRLWFDEVCSVPTAKHDDQADSAAGGYNTLTLRAPLEIWGGADDEKKDETDAIVVTDGTFSDKVEKFGSYFPGD